MTAFSFNVPYPSHASDDMLLSAGPQPSIASTSGLPQSTEAPAMPSFSSDSAAQQQDGHPEKGGFFSSWFGSGKKDAVRT